MKRPVGNSDLIMAARKRTVVMGERKTASIRRLRKGETSRGPREQRPAACKKQAAESNNEVTSNFPWTATLEAKRAGWERDWASDHLEPFLWVVAGASTTCSLAGCLYARAGRRQCGYERACVFAYCIGRIPPLYPRERSPVHLHTLGLGACLAGPSLLLLSPAFCRSKGSTSRASCHRRDEIVARLSPLQ